MKEIKDLEDFDTSEQTNNFIASDMSQDKKNKGGRPKKVSEQIFINVVFTEKNKIETHAKKLEIGANPFRKIRLDKYA